MVKVKYTEAEKESLIDSMLEIIKGHLMKCDVNDIKISKDRKVTNFIRESDGTHLDKIPTGEYTYMIDFKYRREF
ncbi:hypothetical protein D3C73_278930 [compost metagenome]